MAEKGSDMSDKAHSPKEEAAMKLWPAFKHGLRTVIGSRRALVLRDVAAVWIAVTLAVMAWKGYELGWAGLRAVDTYLSIPSLAAAVLLAACKFLDDTRKEMVTNWETFRKNAEDQSEKFRASGEEQWENFRASGEEQWTKFKGNARIVIHVTQEIVPFNKAGIDVCQELFLAKVGDLAPQREICAMDHNSPEVWWTNDMLGYLAAQCQ